tara:strand:- start:4 stop:273 length:270 start_codon:yes stop_codon:yes gene_type:complete
MAIDNKELAKYLRKQIRDNYGDYFISAVPTQDALEYWIQGFHSRKCVGHSEWSEEWQKNIWIPDEEEDMTIEPFLSFEDFKKEKGIDDD